MISQISTKLKKLSLATITGAAVLFTASQAYNSNKETYIIQGASQQTIVTLVNQVGGKVNNNIDVISAVSATLTEEQVKQLNKSNPLIRFTNKTAGFVWKPIGQNSEKTAGFVWKPIGQNSEKTAGFVWKPIGRLHSKTAGFVWKPIGRLHSKTAGFVWKPIGR